MKNPVKPSGIESATLRIEAQYLNQLRYRAQDDISMVFILFYFYSGEVLCSHSGVAEQSGPWDVKSYAWAVYRHFGRS
jgi:hypothetical protein